MTFSNSLIDFQSKLDSTLFVGIELTIDYINSYHHKWNNLIWSVHMKNTNIEERSIFVNEIVDIINKKKVKLVCFLYNCTFIEDIVKSKKQKKFPSDVKIIAWHQKHFFSASIVPDLEVIIEYSKVQSLKYKTANKALSDKYVFLPYPSILQPNYQQLFDDLPQHIRDRYAGKYIFVGGNNRRDCVSIMKVCKQMPEHKCVVLTSSPKFINKFNKIRERETNQENITNNMILYSDSTQIEFAYAVQKSHVCFLPYNKYGGTIGHSVVAQAIMFGKPIVSNINCSIDESVIHNKTGYLDKVGDIEMYVLHLTTLMENKDKYNLMKKETEKISHTRSFDYFYNAINKLVIKALSVNKK